MAALYGVMGLNDVKNMTVQQIGQRQVFDAIGQLLAQYNADLADITSFFVQGETTDPQITYIMPGGGMMQESTELTRPGAVRPPLGWPVGFEMRDARDQVGWDDIALAYATVEIVQSTVDNVMIRHSNWVRYNLLRAIFSNVARTFNDPLFGVITVQPLANNDTVVYPPNIGQTAGAVDNHYLAANLANLSDANNPFPVWVEELAEHGGAGPIVAVVNPVQANQIRAMTAFIEVADSNLRVMQGVESVYTGPPVPGNVIGIINGAWISEWRWMPAGYVAMRDMSQPAPLLKRLDRVQLPGRGELALVATQSEFPLIGSFWRDRHGYGVANRLNGLIGQVTGASYVIPPLYA
jgi:hypothetical protein